MDSRALCQISERMECGERGKGTTGRYGGECQVHRHPIKFGTMKKKKIQSAYTSEKSVPSIVVGN